MTRKRNQTVYRRSDGKWVNKRSDASEASSVHNTQREAEEAARRMLKSRGGGELVVKGRDGKIRSKNTIAPGRDPNPPQNPVRAPSESGSSKKQNPASAKLDRTSMYDPPHPGEIIREDCLKPLDLSVTKAAEGLGISRKHLSDIVNGHSGISPEMAIRLSKGFGGSPESWLKQQMLYDLWEAEQSAGDVDVRKFEPA